MEDASGYDAARAVSRRLGQPPHPLMDDHRRAPLGALTQMDAVVRFDRAHLVMLHEAGLAPAAPIREALRLLGGSAARLQELARPPAENFVGETLLIRELGLQDGGWLPLGRSTHDMNGVVWRMRIRELVLAVEDAINDYRASLLDRAALTADVVMPHFTHRVEGQVGTAGHALHALCSAAERDLRRIDAAFETINLSPAGVAAGVGTPFPIDRERVAQLLGFDGVCPNTRDAIHPDGVWEAAGALGILIANLAAAGEELFVWHRHGFIELPDQWCRSSSLMPGKRSVTAIEEFAQLLHDRANARSPVSYPVWYWGELLPTIDRSHWVLSVLGAIVTEMELRPARMRAHLDGYWALGVDVAALLVREHQMSWRQAHQVVASAIQLVEAEGGGALGLDASHLRRAATEVCAAPLSVTAAELERVRDPLACVARNAMTGGPAPAALGRAIARSRELLAGDRERVAARRRRLADADAALTAACERIAAG